MCRCGYVFFFQAEDGIRDLVRSRGLGDVYKRQDGTIDAERVGGAAKLSTDKITTTTRDPNELGWRLSLIHI